MDAYDKFMKEYHRKYYLEHRKEILERAKERRKDKEWLERRKEYRRKYYLEKKK